ncbi:MAG: hypothetical protein ABJI22_18410 [Maribacter sp.]
MTGSLISLVSVFIGIISANLFAYFKKKFSFGFTGNTLVGVFGSILFIKTFGRLGYSPWSIAINGDFDGFKWIINMIISALGGVVGLIIVKKIYSRLNN